MTHRTLPLLRTSVVLTPLTSRRSTRADRRRISRLPHDASCQPSAPALKWRLRQGVREIATSRAPVGAPSDANVVSPEMTGQSEQCGQVQQSRSLEAAQRSATFARTDTGKEGRKTEVAIAESKRFQYATSRLDPWTGCMRRTRLAASVPGSTLISQVGGESSLSSK